MALTAARVLEILAKAEAKSREMGLRTTTAVVDENGLLFGFLRMEGARFTTVDIAQGKAKGCAAGRLPTGELAERASRPVYEYQMMRSGALFAQGAVPILEDGEFIGACGVSGAPGGEQDEVIAYAAIG